MTEKERQQFIIVSRFSVNFKIQTILIFLNEEHPEMEFFYSLLILL